jgi:hypothetical protein
MGRSPDDGTERPRHVTPHQFPQLPRGGTVRSVRFNFATSKYSAVGIRHFRPTRHQFQFSRATSHKQRTVHPSCINFRGWCYPYPSLLRPGCERHLLSQIFPAFATSRNESRRSLTFIRAWLKPMKFARLLRDTAHDLPELGPLFSIYKRLKRHVKMINVDADGLQTTGCRNGEEDRSAPRAGSAGTESPSWLSCAGLWKPSATVSRSSMIVSWNEKKTSLLSWTSFKDALRKPATTMTPKLS